MPGDREYRQSYYLLNKDKIDAENKAYKQANKEKMAAYYRDYRAKNKAKLAEQARLREEASGKRSVYMKGYYRDKSAEIKSKHDEWKKANPTKSAAIKKNSTVRRRRLIGGQAISKFYTKQLVEIYANCPEGHHVDHVIPLRGKTVSGLHIPINLQYLPAADNIKKSNDFSM